MVLKYISNLYEQERQGNESVKNEQIGYIHINIFI